MMRFAVLTVSDRCSRGEATDESGPRLRAAVESVLNATCVRAGLVPDEKHEIEAWIRDVCDGDAPPDLLVTTGGTGLAPRDVTPEATAALLDRQHSGLMELIRLRCLEKTPLAFLSRGIAGTRGSTLVINLPGSPRGAVESLEALGDVLEHALETLRDDDVSQFHARMQDES